MVDKIIRDRLRLTPHDEELLRLVYLGQYIHDLHTIAVGRLTKLLSFHLGYTEVNQERMKAAGEWHDSGKVYYPQCRSRVILTDNQRREVTNGHCRLAPLVLEEFGIYDRWVWEAAMLHHHDYAGGVLQPEVKENLFPFMEGNFLKGERIPEAAMITRVCDFAVAQMEDRDHRNGKSVEEIVHKMDQASGTQLAPRIVDVFKACCLQYAVELCSEEFRSQKK